VAGPVDLAYDHLRLADGQLEPLAAHHLHEDRQRQLASALDLPHVGALGLVDAQRHVADQLAREPCLQLAGGHVGSVQTGQGGAVDPDRDRDRGLVDGDRRQRPRVLGVRERLADRDPGDAGHGDDLAGAGLGGVHAVERLGDVQLGDPHPLDLAVSPAPGHRLTAADGAVAHAADRYAAHVGGGVEVGDVGLKRHVGVVLGRRDMLDQQVEQRLEAGALVFLVQ
jgi:hypothetical protein